RLRKQMQELELAAGELEAASTDESLELIRPDLQLTGGQRADVRLDPAAAAAAHHRLEAGDPLLGVTRLAYPLGSAQPQPSPPLGDCRLPGAAHHADPRQHPADTLQ